MLNTFGGRWANGDAPGGSITSLAFAVEWNKLGHEVHYLTNSFDTLTEGRENGLYIHILPSKGVLVKDTRFSFVTESIANITAQLSPAVDYIRSRVTDPSNVLIVATSPYPSDVFLANVVCRKFRARGVVYLHHLSPPPWWHHRARGGLARTSLIWLITLFALVGTKMNRLLPSVTQERTLKSSGWRFDYGILRHEGFLTEPATQSHAERFKDVEACFISRISENKGVLDLLRIWKLVVSSHPDAKLVIAGRVQHEDFGALIKKTIRMLGINSSVRFVGYLSSPEKFSLLMRSKVFLFPSYEEGWSLGVMEAASYGAVPITYDLAAYDYLGRSAVRVPVANLAKFAEATIRLLENDVLRESKAKELSACVAKYTLDRVAREEIDYLAKFLHNGAFV